MKKKNGSGGIRTHASEETGALNQRLRPLGHATCFPLMEILLLKKTNSLIIVNDWLAEWSKALVLGTSLFGGVGSNPTPVIFFDKVS